MASDPQFPTTNCDPIRKVQKGGEAEATAAMEEICRQYWYPIYAFNAARASTPMTPGSHPGPFSGPSSARETIQAARQEKGRLRSFISACCAR